MPPKHVGVRVPGVRGEHLAELRLGVFVGALAAQDVGPAAQGPVVLRIDAEGQLELPDRALEVSLVGQDAAPPDIGIGIFRPCSEYLFDLQFGLIKATLRAKYVANAMDAHSFLGSMAIAKSNFSIEPSRSPFSARM